MDEIIHLTEALIRFESTHSNPFEVKRCADFIQKYLADCQAEFQRLEYEGIPSFLVMPQSNTAPILLMSHFDVVPGDTALFDPTIKNGNLYGRGALDDKYAVAISLVLLKNYLQQLRQQGLDQNHLPFGILITGDEESGGMNGAKKALAQIKTRFCIALDGGSLEQLVIKEKGIARLKLIADGIPAHSARPWLGDNAIDKLIEDYLRLKTFFISTTPDRWHRTINFSRIEGGKAGNQVPDYAEALFDIRFTENDDIDGLLGEMQNAIQGRLELLWKEPLFMATPSPYLDLLMANNPNIRAGSEHGSSDARFLSVFGINGVVWGADGGRSHHSNREHVNIDSVRTLYSNLNRYLNQISRVE